MPQGQERVFTIEEIAETLKVSVDTVRRMIRDGEIHAIKVRGQWRITKEALDHYLQR